MSTYRDILFDLLSGMPQPLTGAEVGVHRGKTSEHLLKALPGLELYCVDSWEPYHNGSAHGFVSKESQAQFHQEACRRLAGYSGVKIVHKNSAEAIGFVPDGLDFVFLDANHAEEWVWRDTCMWWRKLRRNGVFVWHDYGKPEFGVTPAVDRFVKERSLKLNSIGESLVWTARN